MFRSIEMSKCEIYIQPEAAFETLTILGHMDCVEFLDANEDVQVIDRKFVPELCRCVDMERKLKRMETEMIKDDILIALSKNPPKPLQPSEMLSFENTLEDWEVDLEEISSNQTILMKSYLQLSEMHYVLKTLGSILGGSELLKDVRFAKFTGTMPGADLAEGAHLIIITGVVQRARCFAFETMLWRISHSNMFFRQATEDKILKDPVSGIDIRKVAFIIIVQGVELSNRIEKVCHGFKANLYNCPRTLEGREDMIGKLATRIHDMETVLSKTRYHRCKALRAMGRSWQDWMNSTKMAKTIYHHMNLFTLDITTKCLIGQCWIPKADLKVVQKTISKCSEQSGAALQSFITVTPTTDTPPTHFATNKFTIAFQHLINAYGESKYGEVNPGLYTIITFPFLFAMMFGDIGHAFIMASFASWMIWNERKFLQEKSKNEIWNIFFGGRYIILLMGLFSMFTGFVYNDMFAKQMVLVPSAWKNQWDKSDFKVAEIKYRPLSPFGKDADSYFFPPSTYVLGRDPIWTMAKNKMVFENSLKMKISIVVGVIHMVFGIFLSVFNHIHFKHTHAIFLEFIPQMIFLCNLFLYLVFMMFMKWVTYSMFSDDHKTRERCAPLLLIYFIDMVLMRDTKALEEGCDAYMYSAQPIVQKVLLFSALACVPILLCGVPCYEGHKNKKKILSLVSNLALTGESGDGLLSGDIDFACNLRPLSSQVSTSSISHSRTQMTQSLDVIFNKEGLKSEVAYLGKYFFSVSPPKQFFVALNITTVEGEKVKPRAGETEKQAEKRALKDLETLAKYPLFGELIITQSVHTIEFVLSTVSHTASYLRLWALSLAHAQLSEMLWEMILGEIALQDHTTTGFIKIYVIFAVWATFTVSVMVLMEGLSAFLHTLRLHWVEFMSKFFIGGGYNFKPLSFSELLNSEDGDDHSTSICMKKGRSESVPI